MKRFALFRRRIRRRFAEKPVHGTRLHEPRELLRGRSGGGLQCPGRVRPRSFHTTFVVETGRETMRSTSSVPVIWNHVQSTIAAAPAGDASSPPARRSVRGTTGRRAWAPSGARRRRPAEQPGACDGPRSAVSSEGDRPGRRRRRTCGRSASRFRRSPISPAAGPGRCGDADRGIRIRSRPGIRRRRAALFAQVALHAAAK